MKRTVKAAFWALGAHAWHGKNFSKLTAGELQQVNEWLILREHLTADQLELEINRLWLDATMKPKNANIIRELLSCANTIAKGNDMSKHMPGPRPV